MFQSQIGAWKRILTNLFGNSLKYTDEGFVQISLKTETSSDEKADSTLVALEIQDSGIGMTPEFLTNQLYMPFVQANPLSVGTGLGLSIVRQLVKDLRGYIEVESKIQFGTSMKVAIPVKTSRMEDPNDVSHAGSANIRDIGVLSTGLTLCIIGFDYLPGMNEAPNGILSVQARRIFALRRAVTTFAKDWFGMKVFAAESITAASGHVLLGLQSRINQSEMMFRNEPLIVLEDIFRGQRIDDSGGILHLSQP